MKSILILLGFFIVLLSIQTVSAITCDAAPTATTVDLGLSKKVTISCSDWGSVTSVTVEPTQYNADCLSLDKTSDTITSGVTKDFTITAISMACQENVNDRTIIWKFTPSTGSVASKSTTVAIQSGLTITATFKNAPYSATVGSSVNIILEVSTTANENITGININMSGSSSALGLTDKSISKIAASVGEKTQQVSWTITAPSAGSYNLKAVVTSQNADSDTASTTLTTTAEEEGAPSGGPSGPGAPGAPPAEKTKVNVTRGKATITIPSIAAGKMAQVNITKDINETNVKKIIISVKNSVNNIKIEINKVEQKPAEVIVEVVGKVYHYLKIDKENITDDDIDNATIQFQVAKSWITNNNINETTVALNRYVDNTWNKLSTTKLEEDDDYIYYEATTLGLSIFAISGEEKVEVAPPVPPAKVCTPTEKKCVGNDLQQCNLEGTAWTKIQTCDYGCNTTTLACNPEPVEKLKVVDYTWLWVIIITIVIIIGGVYYSKVYKKKL